MMWKAVRIGDLGKVITGKTPSSNDPEYFGDEYPFITPTDMDGKRKVVTARKISEEGYHKFRNQMLPIDSVCFVCIGSIGKLCITSETSLTNQQINSVVVNRSQYDPFFVYYVLSTFTEKVASIAGGVATPIVNKTSFENITLLSPPLTIQRKIAAILSAYDDLIENNLRRIKILEEMAQNLYREWFVKFRFPGYEKVKFVDSPLGMIPEGWEVTTLGDYCCLTMGQSPKSEYYNDVGNGLPFHQGVSDFGHWHPSDRLYCSVDNRIAEANDILFSVRAPVGRMNFANKKIIIGRGLSAIRAKNNAQSFLWEQLRHQFTKVDMIGNGAIFASVTKNDMQRISILSPPDSVVEIVNQYLAPLHNQISCLVRRNDSIRTQRDHLLPKLVSGEVDVSDLNIKVSEEVFE